MKLTTIWSIPAMSLRERLRRTWDEWFLRGLAHRLPRRLAYWSFIDVGGRHTGGGNEVVTEVPYMTVLNRIGTDMDGR